MMRRTTPLRALLFVLLLAWVPDFNNRDWVRQTLEHRCRDVRFRPSRTRPAVLREIQGMIRLPTAVARTTVAAWRQR